MALFGFVDEISRSRIEGWVVDPERPGEAVTVSIFVNGEYLGISVTTHARPNLVSPSGEPITGKCGFYFAFDPPLSPFIEQRVEVVEAWSAQVLPNGSKILPRPSVDQGSGAAIVPILLTSTGRTGTTLLMSEFVRHPDMVVGDSVPYEIKQIAYYAAAFRALATEADRERSTDPETMLANRMSQIIGSNPYNAIGLFGLGGTGNLLRNFYQSRVPSGLATLFRKFILEFYSALATSQGKSSPLYFCEKGDVKEVVGQGARLFFEAVKEIVVVRDPRDLLCSAMAFWKQRPDDAVTMLRTTIPQVARIARHAEADTTVIRYEDLISDPVGTRRALSEFLDLDLPEPALDEANPIPDSHRTTRDSAASIGRWRNELTPEQVEACEVAFGPYMRRFGYDRSAATRRRTPPASDSRPASDIRKTREKSLLVAEGAFAVSTFAENTIAESEDGVPWRRMLDVRFGRQGGGTSFTLDGWAPAERGFTWSNAHKGRVRLPAVHKPGNYMLHVTAAPFTHAEAIPAQRMIVWLNSHRTGTIQASDICVVSLAVPEAVAVSGRPITLTFHFPDATCPDGIIGGGDKRTLGFALHRITLYKIETIPRAADGAPTVDHPPEPAVADAAVAARISRVLRLVFKRPDLEFRSLNRLRGIPGFDANHFIQLILGLEAEFGIELHEDDVDAFETLGDILKALSVRSVQSASNSNAMATELAGC